MRLTVLGSGTSFGVPVIGCHCPVCTSGDPRDRRTRSSAVIESDEGSRLLIDTSPELRLQLVGAGIDSVDAVLYTHEHADHVHGIDDLRSISVKQGTLPLRAPPRTVTELERRFDYIFDPAKQARPGTTKPQLDLQVLPAWEPVTIAGITVTPFEVDHGGLTVYGYRCGPMAYVTDVKTLSDRAMQILAGVEILVLNALLERPHPGHLSIDEAVAVSREIGASQVYLTHLTHKFSHEALDARLPDGIEPAYDGLTVNF